jgi:hypothetical protein
VSVARNSQVGRHCTLTQIRIVDHQPPRLILSDSLTSVNQVRSDHRRRLHLQRRIDVSVGEGRVSALQEVKEMPVWSWFFIAAGVLIALTLLLAGVLATTGRRRTRRLKEQFGPEYERAVDDTGDRRAAENELVARERKRQRLDIVALSPEAHQRYAQQWTEVQRSFVDEPSDAVGFADRLVTEVMRERGYSVDDFDQQASDISVDHPHMVEHYRAAHTLYLAQEQADIGTEAQRQAFVHYRALFEQLLGADDHIADNTPKEATA